VGDPMCWLEKYLHRSKHQNENSVVNLPFSIIRCFEYFNMDYIRIEISEHTKTRLYTCDS
jgi:hypothetical protein